MVNASYITKKEGWIGCDYILEITHTFNQNLLILKALFELINTILR